MLRSLLPFRRRRPLRPAPRASSRVGPKNFALRAAERPRPQTPFPWRRLMLTALSLAMFGGLAYAAAWLYMGDSLRVQQVNVLGAQVTDPQLVAGAADVAGDSLLHLDTKAIEQRIRTVPGVKSGAVTRDWPQGLTVDIVEHQGWGYWQIGARRLVIDEAGNVLDRARPPAANAPTIIEVAAGGELPQDVVSDTDTVRLVARLLHEGAFKRLDVQPVSFVFRHDRGLVVVVEEGPNVIFGDTNDFEFKVATWDELLDELEQSELVVAEIDLRFGRNVVLR
ncbi:MAG: FtsQ-type POTRA domain-containing protein [Dehalococcoidia bacterium]|nr:FtsQ-type POTRA domain-containing protein [Dehalococcoidia bacterium]